MARRCNLSTCTEQMCSVLFESILQVRGSFQSWKADWGNLRVQRPAQGSASFRVCVVRTRCDGSNCAFPAELIAVRTIDTSEAEMQEEVRQWNVSQIVCARGHSPEPGILSRSSHVLSENDNLWMEFWICRRPTCKISFAAPLSTFPRLNDFLTDRTKDNRLVMLLCDACSLLSAYSKSDLPQPRMLDISDQKESRVLVRRVFVLEIECAGTSCASRIEVFVPTWEHYYESSTMDTIEKNGSPDASVVCPKRHAAKLPIRVESVRLLFDL